MQPKSAVMAPSKLPKERDIDTWQELESVVQGVLKDTQRYKKAAWHRFYDTRSTQGGYLPPQPSDFMLGFEGRLFFIESKFSEVHDSLKSCFSNNVSDQQLASHRIWARAGFDKYLVVFYSSPARLVEVWDGGYLAECRSRSKRLCLQQRRVYPGVVQALREEIGCA